MVHTVNWNKLLELRSIGLLTSLIEISFPWLCVSHKTSIWLTDTSRTRVHSELEKNMVLNRCSDVISYPKTQNSKTRGGKTPTLRYPYLIQPRKMVSEPQPTQNFGYFCHKNPETREKNPTLLIPRPDPNLENSTRKPNLNPKDFHKPDKPKPNTYSNFQTC